MPSGVLQGSVLGPALLSILSRAAGSKAAGDAKLSGAAGKTEGRDATQKDTDRLKSQAQESLLRLNKAKCKALGLGQGNLQ